MAYCIRTDRQATDWTAYYGRNKSWFSTFTQQFTLKEILRYIKEDADVEVVELGGGSSCFAKEICSNRTIETYDIIDNNELAIEQFIKQELKSKRHHGYRLNLLKEDDGLKNGAYDFVYSVGLIEHFLKGDIATVIEKHFQYCKPEGTVLISFPTPTVKYRIVRKCMELAGAWQFHDEIPLKYGDIKDILEKHGEIQTQYINRNLPLTQMIVVVKKRGN